MTSSLAETLQDETGTAFVPVLWDGLPDFLQSAAPPGWRRDADLLQRYLGEAVAVCRASAVAVPLPGPRLWDDPANAEVGLDDVLDLPEVATALEVIGRLSAIGRTPAVCAVDAGGALRRRFPEEDPDDRDDVVSDLARGACERGAQAIAVHGPTAEEVDTCLANLRGIGRYYDVPLVGVTPTTAWVVGSGRTLAVLTPGRPWPGGVVVTSEDVTTTWSAQEVRDLMKDRP